MMKAKTSPRTGCTLALLAAYALLSSACAPTTSQRRATSALTTTPAAWPVTVTPSDPIKRSLECIRQSGALKQVTFAVGPWVDSTGKHNAVATGATGAFLPQAGTASFVTDTLRQAGAQVLVQYFGPADIKVQADYAINGIFNSLDFGSTLSGDVRVAGIGPISQNGWAQLTLTVQLDNSRTRINHQTTVMSRVVRYTALGVSAGKVWSDTLVTGSVQLQDQQRLQFEAINGPIAMAVIDVVAKEFPAVSHCRDAELVSEGGL